MGSAQQALLVSGASAFNPLTLTSLMAWLNGDNATLSGVPEFDWPSSVGTINYGQNTVARQPSLGTVNGHQVVQFAANKCLVPDSNPIIYSTANSLVCVCTKSSAAEYILKGGGGEGGPAFISGFNPGSGVKDFEYFYASGANERATFAASVDTNLHILGLTHTDNTGNYVGYLDGAQIFSNPVNAADDWFNTALSIIGAFTAGSSGYDGKIGDVFQGAAIWTTTEFNNLNSYLGAKWNISVTLN